MTQRIAHIQLVVRDYDEAIAWYRDRLGFVLAEDTHQPDEDKRWVVMRPAGGRVFLFQQTGDFDRDFAAIAGKGVEFVRPPQMFDYGKVAVFRDLYGNLWDLAHFAPGHPLAWQ